MKIIKLLLSYIYAFLVNVRNWLYENKIIKYNRFETPIVSIGNITVGGNGKTPMTIYLAQQLINKNYSIGIISRGYKKNKVGTVIVSDGNKILCNTDSCGDEPYLMAKKVSQAFVIVDENKSRAISLMINQYNPNIILLDDAFQHRKIKRTLDIVLINSKIPISDYRMLPYGRLREPINNLNRSNIIITTYGNTLNNSININPKISIYNSTMRYYIKKFIDSKFIDCENPSNSLAFCGIANPKIFFSELKKINIKTHKQISLPDHVYYSNNIIIKLSKIINDNNIKSIITTEKDLVKLPKTFLNNVGVYVLCMEVYMNDKDKIIGRILCK